MTDTENILDAAENSYSNVQKAEWTGEVTNYCWTADTACIAAETISAAG